MIALERKSTGTLDRGPRVPYIHIFGSSLENVQRWADQMVQLHEATKVHTIHVAG